MFKKLLVPVLLLSGLSFSDARQSHYKQSPYRPSIKGDVDNSAFYYRKKGNGKNYKESREYIRDLINDGQDPNKIFEKPERSKTVKEKRKKNQF